MSGTGNDNDMNEVVKQFDEADGALFVDLTVGARGGRQKRLRNSLSPSASLP